MSSRPVIALLVLTAVVSGPLFVAACGGGDGTAGIGPADGDGGGGGGGGDATAEAALPITTTEVDPCRGQPLPEGQHHVPAGLCARFVGKLTGVRQLTFAPNGDLLGATASTIHLLRDVDGDGFFTSAEVTEWAKTEGNGNNAFLEVKGGFVYAGSRTGVKRFGYDPTAPRGGPGEDVVVGQPSGGHSRRTAKVYDGFLYVDSGSASNASNDTSKSEYDTKRSLIKRFDLSKFVPGQPFRWDDGEVVTVGLRNANGFARNEVTGKIYAVLNGLDEQRYKGADVHNDNPGEQIVEIAPGKRYGYPFCFSAQRVIDDGKVIDPGTLLVNAGFAGNPHDDAWCAANASRSTTFVQAHTAPLDIAFFDRQPKGALPEKWRGGAFVALHGSWNRAPASGYRVVWQPFNADGTAPTPTSTDKTTTFPYEIVLGGGDAAAPKDGPWSWTSPDGASGEPRPAGVVVSQIDGALYIASDADGLIYRVGLKRQP